MSGHDTISMLWGNMAYCVKLNVEELSQYSNSLKFSWLKKMSL